MNSYHKDQYGVIHQIERKSIPLFDYGEQRNNYGQKSHYLSYLRLGYLQGTIPEISKFTSICDIGFGNGDFLRACQNYFTVCAGYDLIYDYLPESCIKETEILQGNNHYDVVTFFDSLEHLDDRSVIGNIDCNYVIISVPNCKNSNDDWFESWKHRKPDEHLHHFNESSLPAFLKSQGFDTINISYVEDVIRKESYKGNILTVTAKKTNE